MRSSISSLYMIINLSLLSLFLAIVIYLVVYLADFGTLSFAKSFSISRSTWGSILTINIIVYIIQRIYYDLDKPEGLYKLLFSMLLFLMVLHFFYPLTFVIFGAVSHVFEDINSIISERGV